MHRGFRFRLYPNSQQREYLNRCLGATRFLYNEMLGERMFVWEMLKESRNELYQYDYRTEKEIKETPGLEWLQ
jgi:putative transposase